MNDLAKILGINDAEVNIKSINDHAISFYIQTDIKTHSCPNCNVLTFKVHDYRIQKMKDIPIFFIFEKYYFVRQIYWALENVRKRIQKRKLPSLRKYYKRSKGLIKKRREKQGYRTITERQLNECLNTQKI